MPRLDKLCHFHLFLLQSSSFFKHSSTPSDFTPPHTLPLPRVAPHPDIVHSVSRVWVRGPSSLNRLPQCSRMNQLWFPLLVLSFRSFWTPCTDTSLVSTWSTWTLGKTARSTPKRTLRPLSLRRPASLLWRPTRTTEWVSGIHYRDTNLPVLHLSKKRKKSSHLTPLPADMMDGEAEKGRQEG